MTFWQTITFFGTTPKKCQQVEPLRVCARVCLTWGETSASSNTKHAVSSSVPQLEEGSRCLNRFESEKACPPIFWVCAGKGRDPARDSAPTAPEQRANHCCFVSAQSLRTITSDSWVDIAESSKWNTTGEDCYCCWNDWKKEVFYTPHEPLFSSRILNSSTAEKLSKAFYLFFSL